MLAYATNAYLIYCHCLSAYLFDYQPLFIIPFNTTTNTNTNTNTTTTNTTTTTNCHFSC